jgi:ferredoxin
MGLLGWEAKDQRTAEAEEATRGKDRAGDIKRASSVMNSSRQLQVILSRCPQNHPCPSRLVCPTGALAQRGFSAPTVDHDKCVACGRCVSFCPRGALQLR